MTETINFQLPENGFGNYVKAILPSDQAVLAGAFAASMMQIKNIQYTDLETFAQCVYSMETNNGLTLINGTNVPTDTFLVNQALSKVALGSDLYGTYNMSNFIGTVTGLPYPLGQIYNGIAALESETLYNIYDDIYLAVQWEPATLTYTLANTSPSNWYIDTISVSFPGGGYGRGSAPAPTITLPYGASATCVIGTDPNDLSTFGKVIGVTLISGGSHSNNSGWYATIEAPPTSNSGGTNSPAGTVGWPSMNTVIDNYVIDADTEISRIQNQSPAAFEAANVLNTLWNMSGIALKIEQRSRYAAIPPVAIPYFKWLTPFPMALINFIDNMPIVAQDTCPNGPAQSLENNINMCDPGGQSIVGLMRELRNMQRLMQAGLEQDNNISSEIPDEVNSQQCVNGTVPGAVEGIPSVAGEFTLPSWPAVKTCEGDVVYPCPIGVYDPNFLGIRRMITPGPGNRPGAPFIPESLPPYVPGNVSVITNLTPDDLPPVLINTTTGEILPEFPVDGTNDIPVLVVNPNVPVGTSVPLGPAGIPLDDLPYFPVGNVLPFTLNVNYNSSTLLPSQYDVPNAIDKVIECNCDCWV